MKMAVTPKATYMFNAISPKISITYFTGIGKLILKFI
jgi:hypothetical protein